MNTLRLIRASDIEPKTPTSCPFCGAVAKKCVKAAGSVFRHNKGVQVECTNCGARGPIYGDSKSAFLAWRHGDSARCDE